MYTGRIAHRGESHEGQQEAIIESATWEKVKALLAANNQGHRQRGRKVTPRVLAGLVFDAEGNRYTPTHAVKMIPGGRCSILLPLRPTGYAPAATELYPLNL